MKSQQSTNAFVNQTFMDLKTQFETVAKNHQASIQNLETKFDRLADKQSGRPSRSLPSNTQPNLKGHNSKAYQPPQSHNERVNAVFTRSGKSYNSPVNPNDQQTNSETPINFDSDDEDEEPTPQPKTQNPKPIKETPLPKPYKPKIPMPNYGKFLKELISNKHTIEQISATFLSDESSALIQNKVPPKLGDPGSFLIPCNFNKTFSCNALADLGASINLMPYSLYAKLSLERLADRSFQYPVGIAKNMLVEVGKFTFPADFVILEMEEIKQLNLGDGTEQMIFNIDSAMKHSYSNDDTCFSIDAIDEILEEDFDALLDEGSKILHSIKGTLLEEEIFVEFDKFMAMTADENSDYESDTEDPPFKKITKQNLPWVSPIHYVPKKCGITVVTNENDEPVPTRTITGWRANAFRFMLMLHATISKEYVGKHSRYDPIESVEVFMDDFSVFGNSFDTCLNNLDKMLQHCKDAHLVLNWEKCHFMVKEGIVLGHKVSSVGLEVDKAKIDVISKLPPPTNIKGIRSFLEHAGFYRRFIKDFLKIARPLTKLLEKDTPFEFNDECQKAFELLKERLTCAPVIVSPNWNLSFELMCDASDFTVGVVLGQKDGKNFHPIYFASKTLNSAQQKYTVTEKELMAVVFTFDKFRSYLILSKSIVHPDHSALSTYSKNQEANHAIIRMDLTSIRKLNIEIKDRKGSRKFRGPITYPDLKMMKQAMIVKSMITFPEKLLWKSTPKMNHGSQTLQTT
ncbi:reverse transcriptase domain-containing protein [Tanacetum coccineum]|uniref:Reverse transcriptase domain-containing protein n=1 Tax=Tanacetum coccineum TaxID=301880 RepID=A0ABQ5HMR5_9ASTR